MSATQTRRAPAATRRKHHARPWGDYMLRVLSCALLFGSGFALAVGSTFALRMRDDVPGGPQMIAFLLASVLGFLPLLFGRRFLGAFLVSSFILSGVGAYWWTTVPWDELLTESNFPSETAPDWWRYLLVASPLVIAVLYVAASRASRLSAEYRNRGANRGEVSRAACASFLAGMGSLVVVLSLASGLWWLLASRVLLDVPALVPDGAAAIAAAAAIIVAALWIARGHATGVRFALRHPWRAVAGLASRVRSRGRRSPS